MIFLSISASIEVRNKYFLEINPPTTPIFRQFSNIFEYFKVLQCTCILYCSTISPNYFLLFEFVYFQSEMVNIMQQISAKRKTLLGTSHSSTRQSSGSVQVFGFYFGDTGTIRTFRVVLII